MRMPFLQLALRGSFALGLGLFSFQEANAQIGGGGAGGGSGGSGGMGGSSSLGSSSAGGMSGGTGGSASPASLSTFQNGFTGFSTFAVGSGGKNTFGQSSPTRAGAASTGINTTNPFQQYYLNPLQHGYSNVSSATFGEPLYSSTILGTTSSGSTGGGAGRQTGAAGRTGANARGGASGGSTTGAAATFVPSTTPATPRKLPYTTGLASDLIPTQSPIPGAIQRNEMRTQLKSYLVAAKNRLPTADKIDIVFDNELVVLRGEVNSEREKRLAANMLLLTPGIRGLRNEIQVKGEIPPE
ncbi:MAG: BON domain-containing protein [Gemmataceae bacterium]|nr:BON domain-containing protein [Gemmataceae bacterium]